MGQVMLNRLDFYLLQIETQLLQAPLDALVVALVAAITKQNGIQCAIRRVPVPLGIMPASLLEDADWRKRDGDHIDIGGFNASVFQAKLC